MFKKENKLEIPLNSIVLKSELKYNNIKACYFIDSNFRL